MKWNRIHVCAMADALDSRCCQQKENAQWSQLHNGTLLPGVLHFNLQKTGYYDRVTWRRIQSEAQPLSETRQEGRRLPFTPNRLRVRKQTDQGRLTQRVLRTCEAPEQISPLPLTSQVCFEAAANESPAVAKRHYRATHCVLLPTSLSVPPHPRSSWGQLE